MGILVLLFTVVPLVDLWLLLGIGEVLGFWATVGLTIAVAVLGAYLGKREGRKVVAEWRRAMGELRMPEDGLVSGVLVLVGAVLLVTPGVLTDVLGLLCLFPLTRRPLAKLLRAELERRMKRAAETGRLQVRVVSSWSASAAHDPVREPARDVIDAEAEVVEVASEVPRLPGGRA